jgi:zinc/manganese transport system substrate-binding protein
MKMIIILKYLYFFMSIFKRIFSSYISHKKVSIRNSLIASTALFSITTNVAFAESKNYVAVEPLTCDIVKSIALPSDEVTCLVDRKQDVHDLKISPKQARLLKKADKVFTLGTEMTPTMRNWVKKNSTVVLGVSAIDIDDHSDHDDHGHSAKKHEEHDDHDDHGHSAKKHEEHDDHDDHDHGGVDPHVWHDPHNIIKMGKVVSKSLKKDVPERKLRKAISKRFKTFDKTLEDLDKWIVKQVSTIPSSNRVIASKHKAMDYYGDAFGFETISLLDFIGHSSSLRPQNISKVLNELKEENVKVIFKEQEPASKLVNNLSKQSSIPLSSNQIFVDGLMMEGNTITVAVHNTCTIVNELGGSCDETTGFDLESNWGSLNQ